ncbi:hypothetical protein [Streptomyces swartbergensis]|uniref:hypothetical protein n=1 Tax=Streptomyces swartbergensis TaxID=487165 RepID=UPI000A36E5F6|nr:hypothetical protein [Streptomyces swartbergensis]
MTESFSPSSPSSSLSSAAPVVERVDARHRYEILVDGRRAGLTAYRDRGEQWVFFHTEFADIADPVTADVLRWLETELD